MRTSRLRGVDLLRCFFALEVIFLHMSSKARYSEEVNGFLRVLAIYIGGAVAGFFLMSGFFVRNQEKFDLGLIFTAAKKLLVRLGVPYLFFSIIYAIAMAGLKKQSLKDGLLDTLFLRGSSMQLYFLPYLFAIALGFIILSSALGQFKAKQLSWFMGLMVLLIAVSLTLPTHVSFGPNIKLIPLYGAMYILGYCLSSLLKTDHYVYRVFGSIVLLTALTLSLFDPRFISIAVMLCLFFVSVEVSTRIDQNGKNYYGSGGVYLLHTPITNFTISTLLLHFGLSGFLNLYASVLITYGVCLAFTVWFVSRFNSMKFVLLE